MVSLEVEGERLKVEGERLVVEEERLEEEGEVERYLERIESSYNSCKLSIEKIRKYFRSSDRYLALYMNGATEDNVLEKMAENRTKHRGAGAVLGEDARGPVTPETDSSTWRSPRTLRGLTVRRLTVNKEHLSIPFCFIKFICIDKLMQYIQEELSLLLSWYLTLPNLSAYSVYAAPVCGLDEET